MVQGAVTRVDEEEGHMRKIKTRMQGQKSQEAEENVEANRHEKLVNNQGHMTSPHGANAEGKEKRVTTKCMFERVYLKWN
ncbi:hypothetical protein VIGAN_06036400 [Vigna angularis var. angularis]|uniref:Uncharacterized protein n=1 Tax=Vigna angularis var. angularis TaxID=157739 RepID=A0A0S3S995_PHAAN|nr:hypothetical protein VIGAN_06036400 [Vigna angularis var. angularis]